MTWTSNIILRAIAELPVCEQDAKVLHFDLVATTGLSGKQVTNACATLEKHGYLVREHYADGSVKPGHYLLTNLGFNALGGGLTSGPKTPHSKPRTRAGSLRERTWRLLRIKDGTKAM
jgi:hypothetical protein